MSGSGSGGIFADVGRSDGKLTQVLALLLLVAFFAGLILWVMSGLKPVPDVVGMTKAEAKTALEKAGLTMGSVLARTGTSDEAGKVVEQSPGPSDRVLSGSAISLTIAQADDSAVVEDTESDTGAGTKADAIDLPPWAGNPPREETIVDYDSAAMPSGRKVPVVMGLSRSAALSALADAGFAGSVTQGSSTTDVSPGTVLAQKPSAGSYQPAGTTVVIWISTGAPPTGFPYEKAPYN